MLSISMETYKDLCERKFYPWPLWIKNENSAVHLKKVSLKGKKFEMLIRTCLKKLFFEGLGFKEMVLLTSKGVSQDPFKRDEHSMTISWRDCFVRGISGIKALLRSLSIRKEWTFQKTDISNELLKKGSC